MILLIACFIDIISASRCTVNDFSWFLAANIKNFQNVYELGNNCPSLGDSLEGRRNGD